MRPAARMIASPLPFYLASTLVSPFCDHLAEEPRTQSFMEGVMVPPGDEERLGSREQAMAILHEELNTPVSARRILEKAGRLANCDVRDVRLITDEGSRLGAEDVFFWGEDGVASVVFEQIGGGGKKRSRDAEPPLSPSVVSNKAAAANSPLRAAITLGFDTKGRNAFRMAAAACDVDLNAPGEPFKEMVPYVAAFKDGLTGESGLAKKAQHTIHVLKFPPNNLKDTFAKDSSAAGTGVWETVCPFWRNHVQVVFDCEKCTNTRFSEEIRAAYATDGGKGKACKAYQKRACCRWEHSLSVRQLVEKAKTAFPERNFTQKQLHPLAKRFMTDNMAAAPLGTPHPSQSKLDYQVTLYREDPPKAVDWEGNPRRSSDSGAGTSGAGTYFVYMGYYWKDDISAAAGCSTDTFFPALVGGHV